MNFLSDTQNAEPDASLRRSLGVLTWRTGLSLTLTLATA